MSIVVTRATSFISGGFARKALAHDQAVGAPPAPVAIAQGCGGLLRLREPYAEA
jgi:hypothetical protein